MTACSYHDIYVTRFTQWQYIYPLPTKCILSYLSFQMIVILLHYISVHCKSAQLHVNPLTFEANRSLSFFVSLENWLIFFSFLIIVILKELLFKSFSESNLFSFKILQKHSEFLILLKHTANHATINQKFLLFYLSNDTKYFFSSHLLKSFNLVYQTRLSRFLLQLTTVHCPNLKKKFLSLLTYDIFLNLDFLRCHQPCKRDLMRLLLIIVAERSMLHITLATLVISTYDFQISSNKTNRSWWQRA